MDRKKFEHWIYPVAPTGKLTKPRRDPNLKPTAEISYILGVLLGDGFLYRNKADRRHSISLHAKDKDFVQEFHSCLSKVSHRKVSFFQRGDGLWVSTVSCKPLFLFLKEELENIQSVADKYMPSLLIRGFADSDGGVYLTKRKYQNRTYKYVIIKLYNTDVSILELMKRLLKTQFQIFSCIRRGGGSKKACFTLGIYRRENVVMFAKTVGFTIERKVKRLGGSVLKKVRPPVVKRLKAV